MPSPNDPLSSLLKSFKHYHADLKGKRIWLALSGGRDSLSLAHACLILYQSGDLPFLPQLLHVNHRLHSASDDWARQVLDWANCHAMPCTVLNIHPNGQDEGSLREARYSALCEPMNTDDVLLLAHHQDDQVETVLMRLFNGTGVIGLGGMRDWSTRQRPIAIGGDTVTLWRPWLTVSREHITAYAIAHRLPYIDDPTNAYPPTENIPFEANARAWMRSELLPLIQTRYPQARIAIARTAGVLQDANAVISETVQADLAKVQVMPPTFATLSTWHCEIDISSLFTLSAPHQSAVIHRWLTLNDTTGQRITPTYQTIEQVLALCKRKDNDQHTLIQHADYRILRYRNRLFRLHMDWLTWLQTPWKVRQARPNQQNSDISHHEIKLTKNLGENDVDITIALTKKRKDFMCRCHFNWQAFKQILHQTASHFDLDNLKLTFEPYSPAQPVMLYGRTGSKRGKKLAQTLGIPKFMRESILIVGLSDDEHTTPLWLIHPYGIQLLQSPYAKAIADIPKNPQTHHQVVMHIGYYMIH